MRPLTVSTFNIRSGWAFDGLRSWPFRRRDVLEAARGMDSDILALQEANACQRRFLHRRLHGYAIVGRGRDPLGLGEACPLLVSSNRFSVEFSETFWLSDRPLEPGSKWAGASLPRVVTQAHLRDRESGLSFGMVNTHLDQSKEGLRRQSLESIVDRLDPALPWVVAGDFNMRMDDPSVTAFRQALGLRDAFDLPPAGVGCATYHGFTGALDGTRIDALLAPREWLVAEAVVWRRGMAELPSDHWPLRASLIPAARPAPPSPGSPP